MLAWGANEFGQLGDGSTFDRLSPVTVVSGIEVVSAGWYHSLAVSKQGAVLAWGQNKQGQLGDGTIDTRLNPVTVVEGGMRNVAAGWHHSLALTAQGEVLAWGANDQGQLGGDSTASQSRPVRVVQSGICAISVGYAHSLALTEHGDVLAWGNNDSGQLGDGTTLSRTTPVRVLEGGICAVNAGYSHSLALTKSGEVLTWGSSELGQVGDGSKVKKPSPVRVLEGDLCEVVAGWYHNLARGSETGSCWAWGSNLTKQLGDGSPEEHGLLPGKTLHGQALEVHPGYFAISLHQLNDLDAKAQSQLKGAYRAASTKQVVEEIIRPATEHLANRGYARLLNEGNLLFLQVFVVHSWDSGFSDFVKTVNGVFKSQESPPNLWICATALWQGGDLRTARRPGLDPAEGQFAQAMKRAQSVLVVRSETVDLYTRLWCVWELFLAERLGFRKRRSTFVVAGSNRVFASEEEVDLDKCCTSEPDDRHWILDAINSKAGLRGEVVSSATQVRRVYYR